MARQLGRTRRGVEPQPDRARRLQHRRRSTTTSTRPSPRPASSPPGLADLPRTIFDKPKAHHHYDQIAWFNDAREEEADRSTSPAPPRANFDFVPHLRGNQTLNTLSWHISDHYPLFVEFELPQ